MAKDNFTERKENRIAYHEKAAERTAEESKNRYNAAREIGSHIPFGQPILVGHHSERGHRSAIKKIDNNMRKSIEMDKKAEYHAEKAAHIKTDTAIYSDDPEAIRKLKEKIEASKESHELMKSCNRIVKSKKLNDSEKIEKIVGTLGLTEKTAAEILKPDFCGRVGFARYSLTNSLSNIKRMEARLRGLIAKEGAETTSKEVNGVEVVENVEANRIQLIFPGKPEDEVRKMLKSRGFRWSPRFGAWQRHLNANGKWAVERVLEYLEKPKS